MNSIQIDNTFYIYLIMTQPNPNNPQHEPSPTDYIPTITPNKADSLVILKKHKLIHLKNKQGGKVLPNFIIYQEMFPKGSFYKSAILAMKSQETNQELIIDLFCQFARELGMTDKREIGEFKVKYRKDILREYAKQSFFHKLLNNLLRQADDLTQIFYVSPFVKHLSQTIKNNYESYSNQIQKKLFTCYRGAQLTTQQQTQFLENIGGFIQSLGFMSTSLNKQIAYNFAINTIIQIQVKPDERDDKYDYGYVFMPNFQEEEQVLFNVLASFIIVDVDKVQYEEVNFLKIKLEYGKAGALHKIYNDNSNQIPVQDQKILPILISQYIARPTNQKTAIFEDIHKPKHCQIYLELACEQMHKLEPGYINSFVRLETIAHLASLYFITNQPQKATKLHKIIEAEPRIIPELTDKQLFSNYKKYYKQCFRCHPIAEYMLRTVLIAGYYYYTGDFCQAEKIVDDAGFYFRCVQFARRHQVRYVQKISNIYHTYYTIYCAIKLFTLYLNGKKNEIPVFMSQARKIAKDQFRKYTIFARKLQEIQLRIFANSSQKDNKNDQFSQIPIQNFDQQDNLTKLFDSGGLITFISNESTRVFYRLMQIQQKAQLIQAYQQGQDYETAYQMCNEVLEKFKDSENRLQYFYCVLKVLPLVFCCLELLEDKKQLLQFYRSQINKQPDQQWSLHIRSQIEQKFTQIQDTIEYELQNNPIKITQKLSNLLKQILHKFPLLKNSLNFTLYQIIFTTIKTQQYNSAWKLLSNGIKENNLLFSTNNEIHYKIRKIVHCYNLQIMAAILGLSGKKEDAEMVYERVGRIVQAC